LVLSVELAGALVGAMSVGDIVLVDMKSRSPFVNIYSLCTLVSTRCMFCLWSCPTTMEGREKSKLIKGTFLYPPFAVTSVDGAQVAFCG